MFILKGEYFTDKEEAYVIKIKKFNLFKIPLSLKNINKDLVPPQSFCYLENNSMLSI